MTSTVTATTSLLPLQRMRGRRMVIVALLLLQSLNATYMRELSRTALTYTRGFVTQSQDSVLQ